MEFLILQLFISSLPKEEGLQRCVHIVSFLYCYLQHSARNTHHFSGGQQTLHSIINTER